MKKFMGEDIFYLPENYPDKFLANFADEENHENQIRDLKENFRKLKFYTNNAFAFVEVQNDKLFYLNAKVLIEVVNMLKDYRIIGSMDAQTFGDLFEQLLDKGFITAVFRQGMIIDAVEASADATRKVPIVLLFNERTASASELLIGALTDNGAAVSVGEQSYGKGVTSEDGQEYFNYIISWDGNDAVFNEATFEDAEITEAGTYKVSVSGFDFASDADSLNLLFVSTDIPYGSAEISDINLYIDGNWATSVEYFEDPDDTEYVHFLLVNIWNGDLAEIPYTMPAESVEIEFTVTPV